MGYINQISISTSSFLNLNFTTFVRSRIFSFQFSFSDFSVFLFRFFIFHFSLCLISVWFCHVWFPVSGYTHFDFVHPHKIIATSLAVFLCEVHGPFSCLPDEAPLSKETAFLTPKLPARSPKGKRSGSSDFASDSEFQHILAVRL